MGEDAASEFTKHDDDIVVGVRQVSGPEEVTSDVSNGAINEDAAVTGEDVFVFEGNGFGKIVGDDDI